MKYTPVAASVLALLVVFVSGCATTPITSPEVTVKIVPERDLARYGASFTNDPFYAPFTLIMSRDEFVTLTVTVALPDATRVTIDGTIQDPDGKSIARLYSRDELRAYWLGRGRQADPDMVKRLDYLDRYYVPALNFAGLKGRYQYYVTMIGKDPLPRPAKVMLAVTLGTGDPQQFSFDLPPLKK